jgi:L-asparaginase/Glu-tRNA(Gln) amidotransferase subunit D
MTLRCCGLRIAAVLIVPIGGMALNQAISADQDLRVCHMIATGGTIAMKIDPVKNAPVPALSGEDLVAGVPELAKVAQVRVESLFNMPSDHITTEHWMAIRKSVLKALSDDEVSGVIISHGTDTLEETAYFLDLTVRSDKPIVLVGAQRIRPRLRWSAQSGEREPHLRLRNGAGQGRHDRAQWPDQCGALGDQDPHVRR